MFLILSNFFNIVFPNLFFIKPRLSITNIQEKFLVSLKMTNSYVSVLPM